MPVVEYRMAKQENQPDKSTSLGRAYLDGVPQDWYFSGIQSDSASTRAKLAPLAIFLDEPRYIISVGVGAGEEVRAAIDIFSPKGARVHGLDLSQRAISQVRKQLREDGLEAGMVIGDAANMPFPDGSVDGIIESAIHHEIYSYSKDGKDAWRRGIVEAARTLTEDGALLLRDFAAPSYTGEVEMTLETDIAKGFYSYFREQFRVFESWDQAEAREIVDKREPNDLDYPPLDEETATVTLPFANAAEVMLHFRIFQDKHEKGLLDFGDPTWKEINEIYLPPHPDKPGTQAMPQEEYVQTVLQEANDSLADTDFEMICVQNETSSRPKTVQLFAEHFSLSAEGDNTNEELLAEVPNKMELVFKKVKKKLSEEEAPESREELAGLAYEKLKSLTKSGALALRLLITPPRTASTLMEHSLGRNSQVATHVHEPFISLRRENADPGYQTIHDAVEANLDLSDTPTTVVIKEMSQWIGIGREYENLFSLTESPVFFLIRNPLLATESRIKKLIQTLDLREKPAVQETLLNYYATTQGYRDWEALNEPHKDTQDALVADEFVLQFRNSNDAPKIDGDPSLQTQLLDYFAQSKGHEDWRDMIKEVFANRDYKKFDEILQDERIYGVAGTGWEALVEQVKYLDAQEKPLLIVDSTDFRLEPETIVPALCNEWELPFSDDMIVWDNKGLEVNTGQTKPHQVIWYDRLQTSNCIEAPSEISPVLEDFPDFIAEHLASVDLPAYVNLFNHSSRIRPTTNASEKTVDVRMRKAAYKRLRDMGILPTEMEFQNRGDQDQEIFDLLSEYQLLDYSPDQSKSLAEAYANGKTTIAFSMQDVDPIFGYLSNPDIIEDLGFRVINHRYLNTLERIRAIREEL